MCMHRVRVVFAVYYMLVCYWTIPSTSTGSKKHDETHKISQMTRGHPQRPLDSHSESHVCHYMSHQKHVTLRVARGVACLPLSLCRLEGSRGLGAACTCSRPSSPISVTTCSFTCTLTNARNTSKNPVQKESGVKYY